MNDRQREAYEWAKRRIYPSVAARYAKELAGLVDELLEAPTIDPVYLAGGCYCKDCEYWDKEHPVMLPGTSVSRCVCTFFSIEEVGKNYTKVYDFCSHGEFKPVEV